MIGPPESSAEVVFQLWLFPNALLISGPTIGVENRIEMEFENGSVKLVRARTQTKADDGGLSAAVLGRKSPGLQFELVHGIHGRRELVHTASVDVHATQRHSIDQDFVAEGLASVDRAREFVSLSSWHRSKDEVLKLARPVARQ